MYYLGIDLGGTGIKAGVVTENYEIIGRSSVATQMPRPADSIMDDIAAACRMAVEDANISFDEIAEIGIGSPGTINSATGILEFSGNLDMHNYPMREALRQRLGYEVSMENDANAAAYGEVIAGAAKGASDVVCITLGTGVGGGIIIDNKIFSGTNYAGAELGHTVIEMNGIPCNCGRSGCWECYASATALISQTKAAMEQNPDSEMWKIAGSLEKVNGKTAFDGMRAGDKAGIEVVDNYIRYIACGVINVINTFQPDIVCIGGGVSKEGDNILNPLRAIIEKERFSRYSQKQTEIVAAKLGNDAGIIGAAFLFRNAK